MNPSATGEVRLGEERSGRERGREMRRVRRNSGFYMLLGRIISLNFKGSPLTTARKSPISYKMGLWLLLTTRLELVPKAGP